MLVSAVNLESGGFIPAFEVIRYGPFPDVDNGETHLAPGIGRSFWSLTNTPAQLSDPEDVIFVVALMENDDGNPEAVRGVVKTVVASSLASSLNFDRNDKVNKLINDINAVLGVPTGAPNFDDKVGDPQQILFTQAEFNQAETGQAVEKALNFIGDGGSYTLRFEARNPVPFPGDLLWHKHDGWETGANTWANNKGAKVGVSWQNFKDVFATSDGVIYAIQTNGDLLWFKHNGWQNGAVQWANNGNGIKVGNGWQNFKDVFATSDGVIYAIQTNGDLLWFKHNGWQNGAVQWANNGNGIKVGNGWQNFKDVFATSDGVIYAIQTNGDLLWFKHNGWQNGAVQWANNGNGIKVGNGWQNFKTVFATSNGVIYGIQPNGNLLWYRHDGWQTGASSWANNSGAIVGNGWLAFTSVFATSNGVIYAIEPNGQLLWYRHNGWQNGISDWANNGNHLLVDNGWQKFKDAFATYRIPSASNWGPECIIYGIQQ